MADVMGMRSGNPALTVDTFRSHRAVSATDRMTLQGTVNKTGLSLAILIVAAAFVWNRGLGIRISVCGSEARSWAGSSSPW